MVEQATLAWLEAVEYEILRGPQIAVGEPGADDGRWPPAFPERRVSRPPGSSEPPHAPWRGRS